MRKELYNLIRTGIDCIFPRRCAICDRTIEADKCVCEWCRSKIRLVSDPICMKCGKMLDNQEDRFCYDCKRSVKSFNRGFAVFEYEYIKESLFRFKYCSRPEYSRFYALNAVKQYGDILRSLGVEVLIPVPIHKKRQQKRGYNQAYEFAKEISSLINIPVDDKLVKRNVNTVPLKKLGAEQRQKNLKKAFKLGRNDVKFTKVCIVDDIYTTGATVDTISAILKHAGIREVYFVTIAIGKGI